MRAIAILDGALDQPAFNRNRLKAEKLIDSKVLEQLIRVQADAGCASVASRDRHAHCIRLLYAIARHKPHQPFVFASVPYPELPCEHAAKWTAIRRRDTSARNASCEPAAD